MKFKVNSPPTMPSPPLTAPKTGATLSSTPITKSSKLPILLCLLFVIPVSLPQPVGALGFLESLGFFSRARQLSPASLLSATQSISNEQSKGTSEAVADSVNAATSEDLAQQQQDKLIKEAQQLQKGAGPTGGPGIVGSSGYGSGLFSIAGIQPSSIATLLNTVGDTGFQYFNIQDQCRNRAACDLGFMLYKKLSFVHNWLIRASVRSLTDMNNIYTQSWMEGMMGRNCTLVFATCRSSPLEGLMNLSMFQYLAGQ